MMAIYEKMTDLTINSSKPIIFYTSLITPECRSVRMLATHLNIPLREIKLQCYVDTRTEQFRKINPCHTLPVIDDDGFILWESRAIMQYLCNQYAPDSPLYPSDPQERANVDRLLNFDLKTLNHSIMALHYEFLFPSEYSSSRGEKLIAVTDGLTLLEIFLINKNYVACNHLTIADISILASVTLLEIAVEFDLSTYPNIWQWINRLRSELSYYDSLTKVAHDEMRALIQSVRDAHEEWSSPVHKCAFTPNGKDESKCIEEQQKQYNRLFDNHSERKDVARIMAAVCPTFRENSDNPDFEKQYSDNSIINPTSIERATSAHYKMDDHQISCNQKDNKNNKSDNRKNQKFRDDDSRKTNPMMKKIRLTIEPNTGQSFHLESMAGIQ
ncbi:hypothetical protein SSS_07737 [Sarcoptes scabiei]|nr:hypothetical protein SSS_07737 [Sarcoptes scabiei]